jgi:hypothetical protein
MLCMDMGSLLLLLLLPLVPLPCQYSVTESPDEHLSVCVLISPYERVSVDLQGL